MGDGLNSLTGLWETSRVLVFKYPCHDLMCHKISFINSILELLRSAPLLFGQSKKFFYSSEVRNHFLIFMQKLYMNLLYLFILICTLVFSSNISSPFSVCFYPDMFIDWSNISPEFLFAHLRKPEVCSPSKKVSFF